jgi:hypothetical protein
MDRNEILYETRHLKNKPLGAYVKKASDSHFWKGLMNVKETFMSLGSFKVGDGSQVRFWEDKWLGNHPLKERFPDLFHLVRRKQDIMSNVLSSVPLNISFRRNIVGRNMRDWHRIVNSLLEVNI